MKPCAKFSKVSFEQYVKDYTKLFNDASLDDIKASYDNIKLPKRATVGSAGYDFYAPFNICLKSNETICVPTGIRCMIDEGYVLKIYPRSGLGFKYRLQLDNTVGIIDSDYYGSLNEGHIMIKLTICARNDVLCEIEEGKGFAQGIFLEYGITYDDECVNIREGGFGSTDINKNE